MVKKILVSFILSVVLVSPVAARVGIEDDPRGPKPTSKDIPREIKKGTPGSFRSPEKGRNDDAVKNFLENKKETFKATVEQKRKEFKNSLEQKRAEVKEKIEAKKTELKDKLLKIKDERKKEIIGRVDNRLNEINENRMNHFSNALEKLDEIMLKISSRADKAESRGLDVSAARGALTEAKNAIAVSRAAIEMQSGKVYSINITSEEALKNSAVTARKALHDDVIKVFDTVKMAREAVKKAATTLAQIPKVDEESEVPTPASTE